MMKKLLILIILSLGSQHVDAQTKMIRYRTDSGNIEYREVTKDSCYMVDNIFRDINGNIRPVYYQMASKKHKMGRYFYYKRNNKTGKVSKEYIEEM